MSSTATAAKPLEEILAECEARHQRHPHEIAPIADAITAIQANRRLDIARGWAERGLWYFPEQPAALRTMADVEMLFGNFSRAELLYSRANSYDPAYDPLDLLRGRALLAKRDFVQAEQVLGNAVHRANSTFNPFWTLQDGYRAQAHELYGKLQLFKGEVKGFKAYVARLVSDGGYYSLPDLPMWYEQEVAGREHFFVSHQLGIGDQLMFFSLLPQLCEHGLRFTVSADHPIVSLLQTSLPEQCTIIGSRRPTQQNTALTPELLRALKNDMPAYMLTTLHLPLLRKKLGRQPTTPYFPPYLRVPANARAEMRDGITRMKHTAGSRKVVGIAWDCSQRYHPAILGDTISCYARRRSISKSLMMELWNNPLLAERMHFVGLHDDQSQETWPYPQPENLSRIHIASWRFDQTAALIEACDLVVSIDMSVGNLAALLGRETWIMNVFEGEWRWEQTGREQPWLNARYLFRQPLSNMWSPVLRNVTTALLTWSS